MIDIFLTIAALLFISCMGFAVIKFFNLWHGGDNLIIFSTSYGMGVGLIAMQMYFYSRIGLLWNLPIILLPWFMFLLFVLIKRRFKFSSIKIPTLSVLQIILLILIFIVVGYVFFEALIRPLSVWDAVAIWLYKSKVFFIDSQIKTDPSIFLSDPGYPIIVSMLGSFVYLILGHVNDSVVLLTSCMFYVFSGLLLLSFVKKQFGLTYALIFTILMFTTQNFIRHGGRLEAGQADLPLGYYSFVCFLLLMEYVKRSKAKILLLLTIFLGITSLIKSEAIFMTSVMAILIVYQICKTKLYSHFAILFFWIAPVLDWEIYKKTTIKTPSFHSFYFQFLSVSRSVNIFLGMTKEFINVKSWNLLWLMYFLSLVTKIKRNKEIIILNLIIILQILIYYAIYNFFTGYEPQSSAERLYMHIAPLAFYSIALILPKVINVF